MAATAPAAATLLVDPGWSHHWRRGGPSTYTNFTGQADETTDALARNAYGANTARLRAIKKQYDPDNFFRINPNILPA